MSVTTRVLNFYVLLWVIFTSQIKPGRNIYEDDWDLLIILDACRVDALEEVEPEYDFITDINSRWSVGSTSKEFVDRTYIEEHRAEVKKTTLVNANSFTEHLDNNASPLDYLHIDEPFKNRLDPLIYDDSLDSDDFAKYISLFSTFVGDPQEQLHPDVLTDVAIKQIREEPTDRMIVHYMQPHEPYLNRTSRLDELADDDYRDLLYEYPFQYLNETGDVETVWEAYIDNLRLVLDRVEVLLESVDAEDVVITADHGELFGTWGINSHVAGVPHPSLRKVPWVTASAQDTGDYVPDSYDLSGVEDDELEDRLESLGYR